MIISQCFEYWSVNAPGRSARRRPLAAARGGPPPRTRADELTDYLISFVLLDFTPMMIKKAKRH